MKNNDLSNEVPPRVVVTLDVVSSRVPQMVKKRFRTKVVETLIWDPQVLSHLFLWSSSRGVVLELALFEADEQDAEETERSLDRWGTNPFTWVQPYASVDQLVDQMPYRRDLYGICDIPERAARYGSYYVSMEALP